MDAGQRQTEALVKQMENRIRQEYAQAEREISEKLEDYWRRHELKDQKWQEWVADGKKTQAEYNAWKTQQLAVGRKWEAQKNEIAQELSHARENARAIVNHTTPEIYAGNHNFATYQIENDAKIDTSYTLYNREAVERLMRDNPEVLPPAGKKVSQAIAEDKAVAWDKQKLQSVMIQGILQGDSIPHLAERLARTVGDSDMKASIRNARTMATRAQNAGRVDAYKRAQDKGVELEQMWLATMDNRTRHSHRYLDGETRPLGEAFSNGCEYPADPKGDPAEIYNCRCSLRGVVKGLDRKSGQFRDDSAVGGMSYDEWRDAKPEYRNILSQKEKGEAIRRSFIREYGGYGKGKASVETPEESVNAFVNKNGKEIEINFKDPSTISDEGRRARAEERQRRATELIKDLNNEYDSFIETVTSGAGGSAGNVDLVGNMKLSSLKQEDVLHEFAHTMAQSDRVKYDLASENEKEFIKDLKKLYREYEKDCLKYPSLSISSYSHTNRDEFYAEAFAHAKAREKGIEVSSSYGNNYIYSEKILELVDKYFKKRR